jgi:hypothetical protein
MDFYLFTDILGCSISKSEAVKSNIFTVFTAVISVKLVKISKKFKPVESKKVG